MSSLTSTRPAERCVNSMSAANKPRGRPFVKGVSGNPAGRRPGTRHKTTMLAAKLMEADATAIVAAVVAAAKNGDMTAARMVIDRLIPPAKERPISVDLPASDTAAGVQEALGALLAAVGRGEVLPGEAQALAALLEARRKAIETTELEARIAQLEARKPT